MIVKEWNTVAEVLFGQECVWKGIVMFALGLIYASENERRYIAVT